MLSATFLGDIDLTEDEMREKTFEFIKKAYEIEDLQLLKSFRCDFAQFRQPPGVFDILPDNDAPEGDVYLAGDYTEASSINGAIASGEKAAYKVIQN